jgi:Ran GTPase-activating protein (RanGAP) involved in mRNA processing and transport
MPRVPLIISFVYLYHKYQVRVDEWRDEERERERERGEEMQKEREKREREKSLRGNIRTF